MKYEVIKKDVTIIGGGLAGVCAAVAAARLGQKVALVQNRPVLGGNSSSEVRVWVVGATKHGVNRYSRETGIMGEMFVENQYRNPDGNPYIWDSIILETIKAEENVELFLNTDVRHVEADGPEDERMIHAVTGWMMGSERDLRFESPVYLDCTGDGLVGYLAGAEYRLGRESSEEFNESWAPEKPDQITLGSTILFYTRNEEHPVKFVPPSFAKDITQTSIPENRIIRSGDSGCHYWWIEWGGEMDTVHENERIRDELWSVIYGIWDYIKNSGKFDADNMTLEWVGAIPGKREYRRFVGDYILNQNDVIGQVPFDDRVAFGGWSIDLHPPGGMYDSKSGSMHMQPDGNYHIPFRSLYSKNVSNLLFAGRDISATHVAFGTTRVMATCAVMGEAAGTGAALCVQNRCTPREIYQNHMQNLQQLMLKQDASIIGLRNLDPADLALKAQVDASSECNQLNIDQADAEYQLTRDIAFSFPVDGKLDSLDLLLHATQSATLEIEVWDTGKPQNYIPYSLVKRSSSAVTTGEKQWISFDIGWKPGNSQNAFIVIRKNPSIAIYQSEQPMTGVLAYERQVMSKDRRLADSEQSPVLEWSMKGVVRRPFCFRIREATNVYSAEKAIDGYPRPYGGPHMWVSEQRTQGQEEWLQLTWNEAVSINEIHLTFNDDVNEDLINLHHHKTPFDIIPELVKNYRLEAWVDGEWKLLLKESDNRKRKKVHFLESTVNSTRIRLVIEATNGAPRAEVCEIRVYS